MGVMFNINGMIWSSGAENWYWSSYNSHNLGGSGGTLHQENLNFYISIEHFWCIRGGGGGGGLAPIF